MRYSTLIFVLFASTLFAQIPQEATLFGHWSDPALQGSSAYNNTYNEVWGVARNGQEYAIIGSTAGTHFIDVTSSDTLTEAFFVPGKVNSPQIIHRDYHTYGDYLYAVADEGPSSLQIIDLSALPDTVTVVYDSDAVLRQAHNIFIDELNARLYAFSVTGSFGYAPMAIYSLADPLNPIALTTHRYFGTFSVSHFHDGFVRDNIAFLNAGTSGFAIVDFTSVTSPVLLDLLTDYPEKGYNHSGWLTEDCNYFVMADETWGSDLKMLDVQEFGDTEVVATFNAGSPNPNSITHNQIIACDYLYVSYYYDGLQVFDISDPKSPQRVLYYDTSQEVYDRTYEGAWGVYPFLPSGKILVSDMQEGLFVLEGIDGDCQSSFTQAYCQTTTSVATAFAEKAQIQIFPQPAGEELNVNISLTEAQANVKCDLYDLNGRVVQRFQAGNLNSGANALSFRLSAKLPAGMYSLRIHNATWTTVRKVVVR